MKHFIQQIDGKQFRLFDFGQDSNQQVYLTSKPLEVPVNRIKETNVPIVLVKARHDRLVNERDAQWITDKLRPNLVEKILIDGGHAVFALSTSDYFKRRVLPHILKFNPVLA